MSLLDLVLNSKDPKKKLNLKPQYRTAAELAGASSYIAPADAVFTSPNARDLQNKNFMSPVYQNLLKKDYEKTKNYIIENTPKANWNPEIDPGYQALLAFRKDSFTKSPLYKIFDKAMNNKYSFSDFVGNSDNRINPLDAYLLLDKNHYSDFNKARVYTDFTPKVKGLANEWDTIERALFALKNYNNVFGYLQNNFEISNQTPKIAAIKDLGLNASGNYVPFTNTITLNNSNLATYAHEMAHALNIGRGYDWNSIPKDSLDIYRNLIVKDKTFNNDYYGDMDELVAYGVGNDFLKASKKRYNFLRESPSDKYLPDVYDEKYMQQFIDRLKK